LCDFLSVSESPPSPLGNQSRRFPPVGKPTGPPSAMGALGRFQRLFEIIYLEILRLAMQNTGYQCKFLIAIP